MGYTNLVRPSSPGCDILFNVVGGEVSDFTIQLSFPPVIVGFGNDSNQISRFEPNLIRIRRRIVPKCSDETVNVMNKNKIGKTIMIMGECLLDCYFSNYIGSGHDGRRKDFLFIEYNRFQLHPATRSDISLLGTRLMCYKYDQLQFSATCAAKSTSGPK
jgi:hypothetical protein